MAYSFARDIQQAVAMSNALEDYVRGDRLYGRVGGYGARMPSMTVGALLLRLRRLDALRSVIADKYTKQLDNALDRYYNVRDEWAYHYEGKLKREAHSRIDAMKGFFYECGDNIRNCIGIYKPEITRRTIVQEIMREMLLLDIKDGALLAKTEETDDKLRRITEPAEFQWADVLIPAYPRSEFWWLYHSPPDLP